MAQKNLVHTERLVVINKILPEVRNFLQDVLFKENLSEKALSECEGFIQRLNDIIKPPSLPPRLLSRSSTSGLLEIGVEEKSGPEKALVQRKISAPVASEADVASQEFLERQRELSRQGTLWLSSDGKPLQQPYESQKKPLKPAPQVPPKKRSVVEVTRLARIESRDERESIYEKISSVSGDAHLDKPMQPKKDEPVSKELVGNGVVPTGSPPPVPQRKGRTSVQPVMIEASEKTPAQSAPLSPTGWSGLKHWQAPESVWVQDLKNPLYSGLLREVRSNSKRWCVLKRQKLYLFRDLQDPAYFIADLHEYEVFKDPDRPDHFRLSRPGFPSLMLAAINEEQYSLWHNAFRRSKVLADSEDGKYDGVSELSYYLDVRNSIREPGLAEEEDTPYEQPKELQDRAVKKSASLDDVYVSMNSMTDFSLKKDDFDRVRSPEYEIMTPPALPEKARERKISFDHLHENENYSSMPLPPTPGVGRQPVSSSSSRLPSQSSCRPAPVAPGIETAPGQQPHLPPALPARNKPAILTEKPIVEESKSEDESSISEDEDSTSYASLDAASEGDGIELPVAQFSSSTWPRKRLKGRKEKEFAFLHDLSSVYAGVLHQRRMLAVWQKRYCKVKDQCLICYRNADESEKPVLTLSLPGQKLDLADETWKSHSFKIYKGSTEATYFATETREELIKWLTVLAKEINREKFQGVYDKTDVVDSVPRHLLQDEMSDQSTEDTGSGESQENIPKVVLDQEQMGGNASNAQEFDADNESVDGEENCNPSEKRGRPAKQKLLRVKDRKARAHTKAFDDPTADMQGYLYRKFSSHWSRRWCCVKESKLLSFKRSPQDQAELIVLLPFASLAFPSQGEDTSDDRNVFTLRYEGDKSVTFSTAFKEDWENWTRVIAEFVGSRSEEPFPYINVPPLPISTSRTPSSADREHKAFFPDDVQGFDPEAVSSPMEDPRQALTTPINSETPRADAAPISKERPAVVPPPRLRPPLLPSLTGTECDARTFIRSDDEIEKAFYSGMLSELSFRNQACINTERFAVLARDKWLKFYDNVTSSVPLAVYWGLGVQVVEEAGTDPCILRLRVDESQSELVLKVVDKSEGDKWKAALARVHYEEMDDMPDARVKLEKLASNRSSPDDGFDVIGDGQVAGGRPRSATDALDPAADFPNSPSPLSSKYSRTLPHLGKMKKAAKEEKGNLSDDTAQGQTRDKKTKREGRMSALIRTFTLDIRKSKNKSYDLPREESFLPKETHHGSIKQVVVRDGREILEERYCRISGKVFYAFANEKDKKPLVKVPLPSAAIEDFTEGKSFRFRITSMDTGNEFTFTLPSETDLDVWMSALYGEDKLHARSHDASYASEANESNSSLAKQRDEVAFSPGPISDDLIARGTDEMVARSLDVADRAVLTSSQMSLPAPSLNGVIDCPSLSQSLSSKDSLVEDAYDPMEPGCSASNTGRARNTKASVTAQSSSSLSSSVSHSTTGSAHSEHDSAKSVTLRRYSSGSIEPLSSEEVKLSAFFFEVRVCELGRTKSRRWLVLRKSVVEVYSGEKEKRALRVFVLGACLIFIGEQVLCAKESGVLQLKNDDSEAEEFYFIAPSADVFQAWAGELKKHQKRKSSLALSKFAQKAAGEGVKKVPPKSVERAKKKSTAVNRQSMLLVEEDVKAVERFKVEEDATYTIAGGLVELIGDGKMQKEKARFCWIKDGMFFLAKSSKPDKPIKKIDLSNVIILDESEADSGKFAFKLDFSKEGKPRSVSLRANDESDADQWMVAISMGILFHRLSGSQHRESYAEKGASLTSDYEFVTITADDIEMDRPKKPAPSEMPGLGMDIKREIARKFHADRKSHLIAACTFLDVEFPSPHESPRLPAKRLDDVCESDPTPSETVEAAVGGDLESPSTETPMGVVQPIYSNVLMVSEDATPDMPLERASLEDEISHADKVGFSQRPSDSDSVFERARDDLDSGGNSTQPFGAKFTFRSAHGASEVVSRSADDSDDGHYETLDDVLSSEAVQALLQKYSSLKGSSNASGGYAPARTVAQQKPKLKKSQSFKSLLKSFERKGGSLEDMSLIELQGYKEEMEAEKIGLYRCGKDLSAMLSHARSRKSSRTLTGASVSLLESEYQTLSDDMRSLLKRQRFVEKELKRLNTSITRKVARASKTTFHGSSELTLGKSVFYGAPPRTRRPHLHDDGYKSEPVLDEYDEWQMDRRRSREEKVQSIII